jgi:hypothetical protein
MNSSPEITRVQSETSIGKFPTDGQEAADFFVRWLLEGVPTGPEALFGIGTPTRGPVGADGLRPVTGTTTAAVWQLADIAALLAEGTADADRDRWYWSSLLGKGGNAKDSHSTLALAFVADIDCGTDGRRANRHRPAIEPDGWDLVQRIGLPWSYVVHSGGGFQCGLVIAGGLRLPAERERFEQIGKQLDAIVSTVAATMGQERTGKPWEMDGGASKPATWWRFPGVWNCKLATARHTLLLDVGPKHTIADIEQLLDRRQVALIATRGGESRNSSSPGGSSFREPPQTISGVEIVDDGEEMFRQVWEEDARRQRELPARIAESLDVSAWLSAYGRSADRIETADDGRKFWFMPCPYREQHSAGGGGKEFAIIQRPGEKPGIHCFHRNCPLNGERPDKWEAFARTVGPIRPEHFHGRRSPAKPEIVSPNDSTTATDAPGSTVASVTLPDGSIVQPKPKKLTRDEIRGLDVTARRAATGWLSESEFVRRYPKESDWLIEGLMRVDDITLLVGGAKVGKSRLAYQLARHVAMGHDWLGKRIANRKAVYYADFELRPPEFSRRMRETSRIGGYVEPGYFAAQCFRGTGKTAIDVLSLIEPGDCGLLVVDCKYVAHSFKDENSGSELTDWFVQLARHQERIGCAMIVVDHSKKNAKLNAADDVDFAHGSGHGAKFVDSMITLRDHRFEDYYRLGSVLRSGKRSEPISLSCAADGVWRVVPDLPAELPNAKKGVQEKRPDQADTTEFSGSTEPPPPPSPVGPDLRAWRALRTKGPLTKRQAIAILPSVVLTKPVNGKAISAREAERLFDLATADRLIVELPKGEKDRSAKFEAVPGLEVTGVWFPEFLVDNYIPQKTDTTEGDIFA